VNDPPPSLLQVTARQQQEQGPVAVGVNVGVLVGVFVGTHWWYWNVSQFCESIIFTKTGVVSSNGDGE